MGKLGSCAEALLWELCVTYGYCIPIEEADAILAARPPDADAFLDAILAAEGIGQALDTQTRSQLRGIVCDWLFDDGRGRGTKSGLPRLPVGQTTHA